MAQTTGQDALLLWCKENTKGYKNVDIKDFEGSWKDGLALAALVDNFFPGKMVFATLSPNRPATNVQLALEIAARNGIAELLEVADITGDKVDKMTLITYLSQFYKKFSIPKAAAGGIPIASSSQINVVVGKDYTLCPQCKKPLSGATVQALSKNWHPECLNCTECGKSLAGGGKIMNIRQKPYCSICGKTAFASTFRIGGGPPMGMFGGGSPMRPIQTSQDEVISAETSSSTPKLESQSSTGTLNNSTLRMRARGPPGRKLPSKTGSSVRHKAGPTTRRRLSQIFTPPSTSSLATVVTNTSQHESVIATTTSNNNEVTIQALDEYAHKEAPLPPPDSDSDSGVVSIPTPIRITDDEEDSEDDTKVSATSSTNESSVGTSPFVNTKPLPPPPSISSTELSAKPLPAPTSSEAVAAEAEGATTSPRKHKESKSSSSSLSSSKKHSHRKGSKSNLLGSQDGSTGSMIEKAHNNKKSSKKHNTKKESFDDHVEEAGEDGVSTTTSSSNKKKKTVLSKSKTPDEMTVEELAEALAEQERLRDERRMASEVKPKGWEQSERERIANYLQKKNEILVEIDIDGTPLVADSTSVEQGEVATLNERKRISSVPKESLLKWDEFKNAQAEEKKNLMALEASKRAHEAEQNKLSEQISIRNRLALLDTFAEDTSAVEEEVVQYNWEDVVNVRIEGFLMKRDNIKSKLLTLQWRRRWFLIQDNNLIYYHEEQHNILGRDSPPDGVINLAKVTSIEVVDTAQGTFKIVTADQSYHLKADDSESMEIWVNYLKNTKKFYQNQSDILESAPIRSKSDTEQSGYLEKLGLFSKWNKRWFVLRDGMLFRYKSKGGEPMGKFPLFKADLSEYMPEKMEGRCFQIKDVKNTQSIVLRAADVEDMHHWLNNILKQKVMIEETVNSIIIE